MVLYLNEKLNDLYREEEEAKSNNQEIYIHRYESELIKQQTELHATMEQQSKQIQQMLEERYTLQAKKLDESHVSNQKKFVSLEKRLDAHEALLSKISRQLDYLRSILFERSHFLAEKIEKALRRDKDKVG